MEQALKTSSRRRRSKEQIQELLSEFEKSNCSVRDFCSKHNVNAGNFHKWKSRHKSNRVSKQKPSGFATVDIVSSSQLMVSGLFAEVKGIKIYQPVDALFLKELLR